MLRKALIFACLALAGTAAAQLADERVVADDLELVVLKREILSIDARGGGQLAADLEIKEQVVFTRVRGRVGIALTDRRALAVATTSGSWAEKRWRRGERVPENPLLGARVALLTTRLRVIGFDGGSGNLVESTLGPNESLVDAVVGDNLAVAVTDRRVLGLSPFRGGFFEAKLQLNERYEGTDAVANTATVRTSRRLLIFRAPTGTWEERRLDLR
jgi:hypothetical protein